MGWTAVALRLCAVASRLSAHFDEIFPADVASSTSADTSGAACIRASLTEPGWLPLDHLRGGAQAPGNAGLWSASRRLAQMDDVCDQGVDTGSARATGLIGGTGSIGISAPLARASWVISASVRLRKTVAVAR